MNPRMAYKAIEMYKNGPNFFGNTALLILVWTNSTQNRATVIYASITNMSGNTPNAALRILIFVYIARVKGGFKYRLTALEPDPIMPHMHAIPDSPLRFLGDNRKKLDY